MGMDKTTYLIVGIKFDRSDNKLGYDPVLDDRWLPYIEGHEGVELRLLFGENTDDAYLGVVLAESDSYAQGGLDEPVIIIRPSRVSVWTLIGEAGYEVEHSDVNEWLVDLWR